MKTLNLELDLSFIKEEPKPDLKKTWESFLVQGCRVSFKEGLDLKMQSRLFKIVDKLEKSSGSLELEDAEFDIIKDIQERGKFDPLANRTLSQINDRIEEAKK